MRINLSLQRLKLCLFNCKLFRVIFINKFIDLLDHRLEILLKFTHLIILHNWRFKCFPACFLKIPHFYILHASYKILQGTRNVPGKTNSKYRYNNKHENKYNDQKRFYLIDILKYLIK